MPSLDEHTLLAFRDELRKEAGYADLVARAAPRLKNIGSLGGVGAAVGSLGGAGIGAVQKYREARQEGASVGQAVVGGAGGALHGAGRGAVIGGLAGGAGGALLKQDLSGLAQRGGLVGAGSRFGQRQVHSLTGMLSPQELTAVRGGSYGARKGLAKAQQAVFGASSDKLPRALREEAQAAKRLTATENAQNMGLSSLPGYIGAVRREGVGKVLSTGAKEQLSGATPGMAALMVGLPAVSAAQTLISKKEDPAGRGRGERFGEEFGRTLGGITGGVMPFVGQSVLGGTLGRAGKYVGRGVDRLSGKPGMAPTTLEPAEGQHIPSERIMSPAAAGQQPEVGL